MLRKLLIKHRPKHLRFALASVVLAIVVGVGVWYWMNGKNSSLIKQKNVLSGQLAASQADLKKVTTERDSLQNQNTRLSQTLKTFTDNTIVVPTMEILETRYFNGPGQDGVPPQIFYDYHGLLLITVSVSNTSSKTSYFNIGDLKLKGTNNSTYPYYTQSSEAMYLKLSKILPPNYSELMSQSVGPKDNISGTLVFFIPDSVKNFTLTDGNNQNFSISL